MTRPAVTADFLQALDVLLHNVAELTFHAMLLLDHFAKLVGLFARQILGACVHIDLEFSQNLLARRQTNAVYVRQRDFDPFVVRNVDSCNSYHSVLALALLMLRILANDANDALALHDFAVDADFFY